VEHIRIAQRDILEFCSPGDYQHRRWPEDYWPGAPAPADDREWEGSLDALSRDHAAYHIGQVVLVRRILEAE
jgi:hypothetical protein